jgi:ABC-2 type transport system permease protein
MNKIFLIIQREYFSRVKKKSFIIMTILGPILMASVMITPIWLQMRKQDKQKIEVIDESFIFKGLIPEDDNIHFDYADISYDVATAGFYDTDYDAILYITKNVLEGKADVKILYKNKLDNSTEEYIRNVLSKMMYDIILAKNQVNMDIIKTADQSSRIGVMSVDFDKETGENPRSHTGLKFGIGFGAGFLIYIFILLYGVQVMRGVMEEKTSRIVEVMLSSVKPFQLMMGKIVGIALVGLTQFLLWVVLTTTLYSVADATILKDAEIKRVQQKEEVIRISADIKYKEMNKKRNDPDKTAEVMNELKEINIIAILFCFLFYFLVGYLMYAALFAAVGAAVDSESDTQQFMMPVTIPLIFSLVIALYAIQFPDSSFSMALSIIPLTSPIVMMVRLPFGVPPWELAVSMCSLVLGFIGTTWLAGRIYRTGILMYGKKVSWKELGKWLFYKE